MPNQRQKGMKMFIERFMPLYEDANDMGSGELDSGDAQPEAEKIVITYQGEEKELDLEEAKTLAQKGMNYDPIQKKWEESKSKISAFEEIARKAGFVNQDGHGDLDAYREAALNQLKEYELEDLMSDTQLPKELAEEIYLFRQERAERQAEKAQLEKEKQNQAQLSELLDFYKEIHGKEYTAETKLPDEIWKAVANGVPPKYAYAEYLTRKSVAEKQIDEANKENAQASAGRITGRAAGAEKEFFNSEELDRLTSDDLDDPSIFEKAMRSMRMLGR